MAWWVQSKFMVETAKKHGTGVEQLVEHRDAKEGNQLYQSASREVQIVTKWEEKWK